MKIKVSVLFIVLICFNVFSETDTLRVSINNIWFDTINKAGEIIINNDTWSTYEINISSHPLIDSVISLYFTPSHRDVPTSLSIDSIRLINNTDTVLFDDFESYELVTPDDIYCPFLLTNQNFDKQWFPFQSRNGLSDI